jgi:hypothetical protein
MQQLKELILELSHNCNLACVMCGFGGQPVRRERFMSQDMLDRILSQVPAAPQAIRLSGRGESTIHPEFVAMANRLGYRIAHCADAVVEHDFGYDQLPPHRAWARFYRQFRRYADGEPLLLDRHPDYLAAFIGSVEIPVARAHSEPSLTARAAKGATA